MITIHLREETGHVDRLQIPNCWNVLVGVDAESEPNKWDRLWTLTYKTPLDGMDVSLLLFLLARGAEGEILAYRAGKSDDENLIEHRALNYDEFRRVLAGKPGDVLAAVRGDHLEPDVDDAEDDD